MTPPPRKYADAPGTASSAAEINPPADDSDTPIVCLRSISSDATERASGMSSFMRVSRLQRELLERVRARGRVAPADAERVRHFADVHVALAVDAEPVRRDQPARLGHLRLAPARQHLAVTIVDADAPVRGLLAHAETIR